MDAYRKLQRLKQDFHHVCILLDLVRRREELNRSLVQLQKDWFRHKPYDCVDTSGLPRISPDLRRDELEAESNVPKYFNIQHNWKKNKKARRGSQTEKSSFKSTTSIPDTAGAGTRGEEIAVAAAGTGVSISTMFQARELHCLLELVPAVLPLWYFKCLCSLPLLSRQRMK